MKTRTRQFAPLNHTPTQSCFASLGHAHLAGQHNAVDLCDNLATLCTKYSLGAVICAGQVFAGRWQHDCIFRALRFNGMRLSCHTDGICAGLSLRSAMATRLHLLSAVIHSTVQGVCAQPTPAPTRIMSCPSGYAPFLPHRRDMRRVKSSLGDGYTTDTFRTPTSSVARITPTTATYAYPSCELPLRV